MSINATLLASMIVFALLVLFTMKFVWPPITTALDERVRKIADGLAAADKAKQADSKPIMRASMVRQWLSRQSLSLDSIW